MTSYVSATHNIIMMSCTSRSSAAWFDTFSAYFFVEKTLTQTVYIVYIYARKNNYDINTKCYYFVSPLEPTDTTYVLTEILKSECYRHQAAY